MVIDKDDSAFEEIVLGKTLISDFHHMGCLSISVLCL